MNRSRCTISQCNCEQCGKTFTFICHKSQYAYKKQYEGKMNYFCSYKCKTEFEKQWIKEYRRVK